MRNFDFGYFVATCLAYPFSGLLAGLIVWFGVGFFFDATLWVIGLSIFFIAFHYHDMKKMNWRGRTVRYLWILLMVTGIFGVVWFFVPKEDWVAPKLFQISAFAVPLGVVIGLILGVVEGIKPNLVETQLFAIKDWWLHLGGYY